jgi:type IV secretion system protein TrbG
MDPRRLIGLTALAVALSGCSTLGLDRARKSRPPEPVALAAPPAVVIASPVLVPISQTTPARDFARMAPIPNPPELKPARSKATPLSTSPSRPAPLAQPAPLAPPAVEGRTAISAANAYARETSRSDAFVGGMQIFSYAPGRVFEVWTAPLRVTTLTLGVGETVTSKAAGDTVRWQIGETTSGSGPQQRAHVLIKPLERNLETNLVLTTNQRVYLVQLKSGPPESFNAAVAWDLGVLAPPVTPASVAADDPVADPLVTAAGPLDAHYRIAPQGRRPRWSPTSVMTDGIRTFIAFPPELQADEAPALFVVAADGQSQMVNYRQQGGLMVVDRVLDRAELRLGDKRPQIVRITRTAGGRA